MNSTVRDRWADTILMFAIVLGAFLRFNPALLFGFPVGDGGLFAIMVEDLQVSHYVLPEFTTYNHSDIPFAYPPLGFYFGRIVSDLFGLNSPQALRWVPALFASFAIPAFYLLSRRILKRKFYAATSTLFFALMPRALSWFVTGGGITRSPGQFFMIVTVTVLVRLYQEHRREDVLWAGLLGGLTIMSHPEAAVHTVASAIFLWTMLGHTRRTFVNSIGVGLIAFITAAPWWITVLHYHGITPLLSALQTGQKSSAVFNLIFFTFTEEPYATLIAALALVGVAHRLMHRDYLLPLWMVVPFFVEGRSAVLAAAIPLAMLAAVGLIDVILKALAAGVHGELDLPTRVPGVEFGIFVYLVVYMLFSTFQFGLELAGNSLSVGDRKAMDWVQQHTPDDSRFLVLTGTNAVTCDLVLEWFPALTHRHSLNTVQGLEWTKGADFVAYVQSMYPVQRCLSDGDISCVDAVMDRSQYDYVYISKIPRPNCTPIKLSNSFSYFLESMRKDKNFTLIYESQDAVIFRK